MKNNLLKSIYPHLLAFGAFFIVLSFYYYPEFSGKKLIQNDVIQSQSALKEATDYGKRTGEEILWSNSSFGGMPVWRGYGANVLLHIHRALTTIIPTTMFMGFLAFAGFYILMLSLNSNVWLSFIFSSAFSFSSFNIISIEAGHINKVLAMATMAPVLGGIIYAYKKKYFTGAAITAFFLSLHILYAHFQITYYLIMIVGIYGLYELTNAIKLKNFNHFFKASGLLIISAIIAVGPNISQLWTTQIYSKSTTRGGSELTSKKTDSGGLDYDYAMSWSNGVDEVMTILLPYYYGGSSNESLGQNSETYKALIDNNVPRADAKEFIKNIPLYWGDQPFTSGPVYFGSIIVFLFILGLFLLKDHLKWWLLGISIFALLMSMGKNMEIVSKFLFYNFPLYNKFRSVTMAVCIAQLVFPFLAGAVLIKIISKEISNSEFIKGLKWAGGSTLLILIAGLFVSFTADFIAPGDEQLKQLPEWAMDAIRADRAGNLRGDVIRGFIFIGIAIGLLWAFINEKIKESVFYIVFTIVLLIDLLSVDKRYLNAENFKNQKSFERELYSLSGADEAILKDESYFRVLNLTKSPFNDATTSYFHKSIGGYSAIKLGKYQDLIENQLSKNNIEILNMLNTKYIIMANQQNGVPIPQTNPGAMGNAWFVNRFQIVENADQEMSSLDSIKPAEVAYIDKRFAEKLEGLQITEDTSATISLSEYHPNRLRYKSKTSTEQLAVFSEIYYQPGWNVYVDGKKAEHMRANYVLRAMRIPAGEHIIDFKFEPEHYFMGEKISFAGSIVLLLFIAGVTFFHIKTNKE